MPPIETWLTRCIQVFAPTSRPLSETLARTTEGFGKDALVLGQAAKPGVEALAPLNLARRDDRLGARILQAWDLPGVRAGSGLAWHGDQLVVVQDDAFAIAQVDPKTRAIRIVPLAGDGNAMPKASKPDFESIFVGPNGELVVAGSGSKANRRQWALLDATATSAQLAPMDGLYEAVEKALGETPNIEGSVAAGDRLHLFHRGAGASPSAIVEVADGQVVKTRPFDLGTLDGTKLAFTDATSLPDGRHIYLAAAEATDNAIDDGVVKGTAVGVLSGDDARWTILRDPNGAVSAQKVEGIALVPGGKKAYMVTDADDPNAPARLLEVALDGPW